jgi:cytochrome c5
VEILKSVAAVLFLAAAVSGCGPQDAAMPSTAQQASAVEVGLDPALEPVYQRSCSVCHSNAATTGAPLARDRGAWAPRIAQGREVLLDHTINGFNGMPPMGACADCTEEQYVALIEYMANAKIKDE